MDEVTQERELDRTLRALASARDQLLTNGLSLTPRREAALRNALRRTFPVEAALHEAAAERDSALDSPSPALPLIVESRLRRTLARTAAKVEATHESPASPWQIYAARWLQGFRKSSRIALTACAIVAAAIVCVNRWGAPSQHIAEVSGGCALQATNTELALSLNRVALSRSQFISDEARIDRFDLSASLEDSAFLQTASYSNSGVASGDAVGIRLDLPVRALLMEDSTARIH